MLVLPAEAGTQRLKSLDPGQKHAGMTIEWDSSAVTANPFITVDKTVTMTAIRPLVESI
jgi:hypothetical protein